MSVTRRRPLPTRDKARIGPDICFTVSLDSCFPCKLIQTIKISKASSTFSDGAVGRMMILQTRPAPLGQTAPQPPARCEARQEIHCSEERQQRWMLRTTEAKTHRESWYRIHSKEGEGRQEQDESADMLTRINVKLKAQGHNNPQLHRPQQQVSILDGLVGEEGIYECYAALPATNTRQSQDRPGHLLHHQSRLMFFPVNLFRQ